MGFLPIRTTKGERAFIGVITTFAICFAWLKYIEPIYPMSLWGALIIGAITGAFIYRYG